MIILKEKCVLQNCSSVQNLEKVYRGENYICANFLHPIYHCKHDSCSFSLLNISGLLFVYKKFASIYPCSLYIIIMYFTYIIYELHSVHYYSFS